MWKIVTLVFSVPSFFTFFFFSSVFAVDEEGCNLSFSSLFCFFLRFHYYENKDLHRPYPSFSFLLLSSSFSSHSMEYLMEWAESHQQPNCYDEWMNPFCSIIHWFFISFLFFKCLLYGRKNMWGNQPRIAYFTLESMWFVLVRTCGAIPWLKNWHIRNEKIQREKYTE